MGCGVDWESRALWKKYEVQSTTIYDWTIDYEFFTD